MIADFDSKLKADLEWTSGSNEKNRKNWVGHAWTNTEITKTRGTMTSMELLDSAAPETENLGKISVVNRK